MNVTIIPSEHCFFHFKYYEGPTLGVEKDIFWLGFDKYKCLIYGIRNIKTNPRSVDEKEIIMLSICYARMDVIKRLNIPQHYDRSQSHYTINSSGDQIAITKFYNTLVNGNERRNLNHLFCLFSIETGEMECYILFCDFSKAYYWCYGHSVHHSPSLGWLFVNYGHNKGNTREEYYFIHHAAFNESNKTVKLEYVTQCTISKTLQFRPFQFRLQFRPFCFGAHNAEFLSYDGDYINIYDYKNNLWSSKKLPSNPNIGSNFKSRFVKTEQNMICIPYYPYERSFISHRGKIDCPNLLFKLLDDQWENMPISLEYTIDCEHPRWRFHRSFCSFSLLFLDISLESGFGSARNAHIHNSIALCAVINVVPLKVLAMKQIFANYEKFSEKQIINTIDLPHILVRQFFGPRWRMEELFNCDENYSMENSGSIIMNE